MRLLKISHSSGVDEWRGRERSLQSLGVQVQTFCARTWTEGGVPVTPQPRLGENVTGIGTIGTHPALFLYDPRPLWHALRQRPDVVDIHEEPFALATAEVLALRWLSRCRAPYILYTAQNLDKRYPIPFRWLERWALRHASGVSACNLEAAQIAQQKGFPGRSRVIPLGIDPARFAPGPAHGVEDDRITVGFLGRLVPEKGVHGLLEAIALDARLHARVAGAGPLSEQLREDAARLGIASRVQWTDAIDPSGVVAFYQGLDVLAVPSTPRPGWTEQFGRVAIEAMACGVPVVTSDAGALPEVVAGAGIVVPHGDATALAPALVEAATTRAHELRDRGLARAAECTWDAVARDYLDLYDSVLANARRQPDASSDRRRELADATLDRFEIIVVAYGAPALLRAALEPVRELPLTVVDNSSMPEIAALCDDLGVRYLDAGANHGFAAGVNLAMQHRLHPNADVLLLNPDARIDPCQVRALHDRLHAQRDVASVAPGQVDDTGRPARVTWPFPTPGKVWLQAAGLGRWQRGPSYVIGSVLLLRAEALSQVGGLDERFFLYAEEADWAYRAHRLGWRHIEARDLRAVHLGGATSSDERRREAHFHASQERYFRKHFGPCGWQSARLAVWLGAMVRAVALPGGRGADARRRAALYRLGPVRVEGRFAAEDAPPTAAAATPKWTRP